MPPLNNE